MSPIWWPLCNTGDNWFAGCVICLKEVAFWSEEQRHWYYKGRKYLLCDLTQRPVYNDLVQHLIFPRISGSIYVASMYTVKHFAFQILGKNNISNKIMNTYLQVRHFPLA